MVPIDADSSTVLITSVVTAVITFGFFAVNGVPFGFSLIVAGLVGIALYSFGVIPIGILAVAGIAMIVGIFNAIFKNGGGNPPPH